MDDTFNNTPSETEVEEESKLADERARQAAAKRQITQEKQDERASWHKLVVKVINWRGAAKPNATEADKITAKEWTAYTKGVLKINTSARTETVKANLEEIKQKIKKHGGFADD